MATTNPYQFPSGPVTSTLRGEQLNSIASVVRVASVSLTNTQLLHLHTNPIQLIPSPGPNKGIIIISSAYQTNYVSTITPSSDHGPSLWYGLAIVPADGGAGNDPFITTQSQVYQPITNMANPNAGGLALTVNVEDQPIYLMNESANMTGGAGTTGRVTALYYIVELV